MNTVEAIQSRLHSQIEVTRTKLARALDSIHTDTRFQFQNIKDGSTPCSLSGLTAKLTEAQNLLGELKGLERLRKEMEGTRPYPLTECRYCHKTPCACIPF